MKYYVYPGTIISLIKWGATAINDDNKIVNGSTFIDPLIDSKCEKKVYFFGSIGGSTSNKLLLDRFYWKYFTN